jgi:hypothetical protein
MITEEYCNFEVAKLLKEKGFDERGLCVYAVKEERFYTFGDWVENSCLLPHLISAPTHQMVLKWLREVHQLLITIDYDRYECEDDKSIVGYGYNIQFKDYPEDYCKISEFVYDAYEEAVEGAIEYCLKNLN